MNRSDTAHTYLAEETDQRKSTDSLGAITFFLCGDVMTGRGIDQIFSQCSDPVLYESYVRDARDYLLLAERNGGPIKRPVDFHYIWGDALDELKRVGPDVRLINLETSVTVSRDYWKGKGINYRMHPANIPCISAAGIDICSLANNHLLDWGYAGLSETLTTLDKANILHAGAGPNLAAASAPAAMDMGGKGRVLIFSVGSTSSGIPPAWAATESKSGVCLIDEASSRDVQCLKKDVTKIRQPEDLVIVSIHWGGNWGYEISQEQKKFARRLIDEAGVDLIHGHSSHHVKGIEVYQDKLILYGCGDFINDYEGIGGYSSFRGDLSLMYFPSFDVDTKGLIRLEMVPTRMKRFRVRRAPIVDVHWLLDTLDREGKSIGTQVELTNEGTIMLTW